MTRKRSRETPPTKVAQETVEVREISVVVAAHRHNPSILNPDFLIRKKIVPSTWQLERPPICVEAFSQVVYKSKISITVDFDKLVLSELLAGRNPMKARVAGIAGKYVKALPEVEYLGVGINPKGIVTFEEQGDTAREYLVEKLLSNGPWRDYGNAPVRAALRFIYSLEDCQVVLSLEEAQRTGRQESSVTGLQFSANFHHDLAAIPRDMRLESLGDILGNWQDDIRAYIELVDKVFIASGKSL